ncbi:RNA polymerase sigma factor [Fluviicola chungangensis]|uniref:RNA polymerase sigma factor n=1 Tax=Fluviicola chungangensis TaxID=2597671 RepID=A0A556MGH2_9FLAO|nr:sigma-70 family RNA polymerase sigma factor [Fluviicola chungangensis]TSJ39037.1 sigma-70 family RNA polymerase sigma factor [Fluviicola chungangensis]
MEEYIEEFIKGNKKAFDRVYEKYAPSMFGICMRYSNCRDDAQEILQETFIKVYENSGKANPELPLGPWIKTITIRTAINILKRQRKLILKDDESFFEAPAETDTEKKSEGKQLELLKLLNNMPAGYRTIFNLFVLDNLTHKEIAEYLDISEGTSKSQLTRARDWIKHNLEKKRTDERA